MRRTNPQHLVLRAGCGAYGQSGFDTGKDPAERIPAKVWSRTSNDGGGRHFLAEGQCFKDYKGPSLMDAILEFGVLQYWTSASEMVWQVSRSKNYMSSRSKESGKLLTLIFPSNLDGNYSTHRQPGDDNWPLGVVVMDISVRNGNALPETIWFGFGYSNHPILGHWTRHSLAFIHGHPPLFMRR